MLIILIATAWLSIAAFTVMLCRGAALADALRIDTGAQGATEPVLTRPGLVVYETQRGRDARLRRRLASGPASASGVRVRGVRGRG
ncbi:MAG: hypothetical protein ACRDJX_06530, partial [Solirubrobacteraceae bacterium]